MLPRPAPGPRRRPPPPPPLLRLLLGLLLLLLLLPLPPAAGDPYQASETAGVAETPAEAWLRWLGEETAADAFTRTRAELKAFERKCGRHAGPLHSVHLLHAALDRVLVLDVRAVPWPGLGGMVEDLTRALRAGRALRRAAYVYADHCAGERGARSRHGTAAGGGVAGGGGGGIGGIGGGGGGGGGAAAGSGAGLVTSPGAVSAAALALAAGGGDASASAAGGGAPGGGGGGGGGGGAHAAASAGRCSFDPGNYVQLVGGVTWRWGTTQAARVAKATQGARERVLLYSCARHAVPPQPAAGPGAGWWPGAAALSLGPCLHARLLEPNGSEAFSWAAPPAAAASAGAPGGDRAGALAVADKVWSFLRDDPALSAAPLLRLVLSTPSDLATASDVPWVCAAAGHPPAAAAAAAAVGVGVGGGGNASAPPPPPPFAAGCPVECEAYANWRPKQRLWKALRPVLSKLDAFAGGLVGLHARTGGAEHYAGLPDSMIMVPVNAQEAAQTPADITSDLASLFTPCPRPHAVAHTARPGDPPCVSWPDSHGRSAAWWARAARGCGPGGGGGGGGGAGAGAGAGGAPEPAAAAEAAAPGPLGAFMSCAVRLARALAAAGGDGDGGGGGGNGGGGGGNGGGGGGPGGLAGAMLRAGLAAPSDEFDLPPGGAEAWGVVVLSDSPALHCAVESGPLGPGAAHLAVAASPPGHTGAVRSGTRVAVAALRDHYLLGLVDVPLSVTRSAFAAGAQARRVLPLRTPAAAVVAPSHGAGATSASTLGLFLAPGGVERFFAAGRRDLGPAVGVTFPVLRKLGRTLFTCLETRDAVGVAVATYGVGVQPTQDRTLRPPPGPAVAHPGRSSNKPGHPNITLCAGCALAP